MKKIISSILITLAVLFGASVSMARPIALHAATYSTPNSSNLDSSDWESDWGVTDDSSYSSSADCRTTSNGSVDCGPTKYQTSTSSSTSADDAFAGGVLLGLGVLWMLFVGLMVIIGILGMILWIVMLVDVAKRETLTSNERLVWVLVIVLTSYVGAIIYYFMVRRPAKKAERAAAATTTPVATPTPKPAQESASSAPSKK